MRFLAAFQSPVRLPSHDFRIFLLSRGGFLFGFRFPRSDHPGKHLAGRSCERVRETVDLPKSPS